MAISKLVTKAIKDSEIKTDNLASGAVTTAKIGPSAVESSEIADGSVAAGDLTTTLDLSPKTVTLPSSAVSFDRDYFNIALLGFKMAVNESLTVFNLIDGIVDEFHDESGTDEAEGSNDLYNATDDYYINSTQPDGQSLAYSAGFTTTTVTEADTSTAGSNPARGNSTTGAFTVPAGVTSVSFVLTGAGGGFRGNARYGPGSAGGGLTTGNLAVTGSQVLYVGAGEGGEGGSSASERGGGFGGGNGHDCRGGGGGGFSGIFAHPYSVSAPGSAGSLPAPSSVIAIGAGGGGSSNSGGGGAGGGLTGCNAAGAEQTDRASGYGSGAAGGGDQEQGGQGGDSPGTAGQTGGFLFGGKGGDFGGGGGAGYYGGGGGDKGSPQGYYGGGGGGSAYYGHPQITSGATEEGTETESGATAHPQYTADTGEGFDNSPQGHTDPANGTGEDGFALITASLNATATTTSILSTPFAAQSVPTSSRIVVFEEHIDTPTLNTDIIASISRNGGSNFTTATLTDSGYVTGSSGQRILTGQATISGQPSGQSMRWKLALANNQVKIHGVSLSWA